MCQCGCGDTHIDRAFKIGKTKTVLATQIFPGCRDCSYGPGVAISLFDKPSNEWLEHVEIESVTPDEYGSNEGRGIGIGLFDMEDLRAAAKEITETQGSIGPADNQYETLDDWLHDYGQELITEAIRRYQRRTAGSSLRGAGEGGE